MPAFGQDTIRRPAAKQGAQELPARYAADTVSGIVTLPSAPLTEPAEERMIAHNPHQQVFTSREG
ncbi:hypothetical protein [Actinomadura rubrisoli]|uniref:Uncharacterized protein n=1 Tax=Actinomadura rubrisoli TaxID=2530368 RepID=A0A4R5CBN4_9ACTN|nr:hypothetical protein [Actinomadura rubrisoli]TDD96815.1 hypothetical protein E1298_02215 [Actinomadura rubrisoli]